jgi:glutamyl-tRNA reductase
LSNGEDPQQVVELLTHNLVNKLAHDPSVNLREAAEQGKTSLLETVRTLFRLKDGN